MKEIISWFDFPFLLSNEPLTPFNSQDQIANSPLQLLQISV